MSTSYPQPPPSSAPVSPATAVYPDAPSLPPAPPFSPTITPDDNRGRPLFPRWTYLLLTFMFFGILMAIVLTLLTPKKTLETSSLFTQNADGSVTEFKNVVFTGVAPPIPSELASVSFPTLSRQSESLNTLISKFRLTPAEGGNFWIGNEYDLSYQPQQERYLLTHSTPGDISTTIVKTDQAVQSARQFFAGVFPALALEPQLEKISYFVADEHLEPTTVDKATIIDIPFTVLVSGFPLVNGRSLFQPFEAYVDGKGKVTRADFQAFFATPTPQRVLPTISAYQAVSNINAGVGSVLYASSDRVEPLSLQHVSQATLTDARVEYRFDKGTGIASPFYVFTGTGKNSEGLELQLIILTPAVAVDGTKR